MFRDRPNKARWHGWVHWEGRETGDPGVLAITRLTNENSYNAISGLRLSLRIQLRIGCQGCSSPQPAKNR